MSRKIKFRTVYRDANGVRTDIPALKGRDGSGEGGANYDDAQIKAQIAAVAKAVSNQNILDNGFFQVNQRKQMSYTTENSYTVDRWRMMSLSNVVPTDNGLTLIRGQQSSNYTLEQVLEYPEKYGGKTMTLSAMLDDGTIISTTGVCELNKGGYTLYTVDNAHNIAIALQSTTAGALIVRVFVQSAGSALYLRAVKLEMGSRCTLGSDWEPNYTTELIRCQRYYQHLGSYGANCIIHSNHSIVLFTLNLKTEMRTNSPAVNFNIAWLRGEEKNVQNPVVQSVSMYSRSFNTPIVQVNLTEATPFSSYAAVMASFTELTVSADL